MEALNLAWLGRRAKMVSLVKTRAHKKCHIIYVIIKRDS